MKQIINGADFRRLVINAAANIEIHKQQLNDLNVFPVPDGDTGTNMSMTINAAAIDLRKVEDPNLEKASATAASAMLRGARGNSGVILVEFHTDALAHRFLAQQVVNTIGESIISRVRYEVSKYTGTEVRAVNVFIDSMMIG